MALHPFPCDICAQIEKIECGQHAGFLAELPSGFAILGDSQYFPGYTLLLCRWAAPDLEDLQLQQKHQFLQDMALVSQAVSSVLKPHKMNLESLGNLVPHLHFHLFPRRLDENEPLMPVWNQMLSPRQAPLYARNELKHGRMRAELRAALLQLGAK